MISWSGLLAIVAVATAAPQFESQQFSTVSPRTETIRYQQVPVQYQTVPVQVQSIPQYNTVHSAQVHSIPVQHVQVHQVPTTYQHVQAVPVQSVQHVQVPTFGQVQSFGQVHSTQQFSAPRRTSSSVQVQQIPYSNVPVSNLRLEKFENIRTSKPVVRTQTSLPVIQATAAPVQRISSTAVPVTVQHVQQVQVPVRQVQQIPVQHISVHQVPASVQHVQQRVTSFGGEQRIHSSRNDVGFAILRQVQDVKPDGTYEFAYETENGIKAQEHGELRNQGTDNEINAVTGSYSYTDPDGREITVTYVADENGFRAEGDHIPKVPEAILRSLEYLRSHPEEDNEQ